MKILHIHESLLIDGLGELMCGLINELSNSNDVSLCTFYDEAPENSLEGKLKKKINRISLSNRDKSFLTLFLNEFRVCRVILSQSYEVVHIHRNFLFYVVPILLLHNRVTFFYTIHTDAYKENGRLGRLFLWLKRLCFKKKWITPITISPASYKSFTELYKCSSYMIPNGIVPPKISGTRNIIDEYRKKGNKKIFVHVGRISPVKNQIVLCKVFHRLLSDGYNVTLLIVGSVQFDEVWKELEAYINNNIVYLGVRNDVEELFYKADGMCLPSLYEGLPMTLLESIAVGCIPICSPVGGIVNVIKNGENGVLSKSSSEEDYYNAMKEFLSKTDDEIIKMKKAAKESFKDYDIRITALSYLNVYKEVLNYRQL